MNVSFTYKHLVFGVIPSVEAQLTAQVKKSKNVSKEPSGPQQYVIVDMHSVNRVETAAAKVIRTKARDTPGLTLVLCGFSEGSGTAADLIRSSLDLSFASAEGIFSSENENCIRVFGACETAVAWCKGDAIRRENGPLGKPSSAHGKQTHCPLTTYGTPYSHELDETTRQRFIELFSAHSSPRGGALFLDEDRPTTENPATALEGLEISAYKPQSSIIPRPSTDTTTARFVFILSGTILFPSLSSGSTTPATERRVRYNRDSLRAMVIGTFFRCVDFVMRRPKRDPAVPGGVSEAEGGRVETLSDSEATALEDPSDSDTGDAVASGERHANAGHTIYVLPQAHPEQPSPDSETEKNEADSSWVPVWSASSQINMWPEECAEALVLEEPRDSCWLIDVRVPCSEVPSTWSTIEQLRRQAIRRASLEMRVEL